MGPWPYRCHMLAAGYKCKPPPTPSRAPASKGGSTTYQVRLSMHNFWPGQAALSGPQTRCSTCPSSAQRLASCHGPEQAKTQAVTHHARNMRGLVELVASDSLFSGQEATMQSAKRGEASMGRGVRDSTAQELFLGLEQSPPSELLCARWGESLGAPRGSRRRLAPKSPPPAPLRTSHPRRRRRHPQQRLALTLSPRTPRTTSPLQASLGRGAAAAAAARRRRGGAPHRLRGARGATLL